MKLANHSNAHFKTHSGEIQSTTTTSVMKTIMMVMVMLVKVVMVMVMVVTATHQIVATCSASLLSIPQMSLPQKPAT